MIEEDLSFPSVRHGKGKRDRAANVRLRERVVPQRAGPPDGRDRRIAIDAELHPPPGRDAKETVAVVVARADEIDKPIRADGRPRPGDFNVDVPSVRLEPHDG